MEEHVRVAIYGLKKGSAEETAELAKKGMLPIFQAQPGFVRYGLADRVELKNSHVGDFFFDEGP